MNKLSVNTEVVYNKKLIWKVTIHKTFIKRWKHSGIVMQQEFYNISQS